MFSLYTRLSLEIRQPVAQSKTIFYFNSQKSLRLLVVQIGRLAAFSLPDIQEGFCLFAF